MPNGGVDGHKLDFNKKGMKPERQHLGLGHTGNSTSICDEEGNLVFYFNGQGVLNRDHEVMPNGDSINSGRWQEIYWPDPYYGYPGFQNCIILPDPVYELGYYLFHTTIIYYPQQRRDSIEFRYTYIDMAMDGGRGDVTVKNQKIYERENLIYCYLTAIRHENKEDWWIILPLEGTSYLTYLVTGEGIVRYPDQEAHVSFDWDRSNASGTARFSPDGTKYALYNYYDQLHLYDFDRSTGSLSNHQKIFIYPQDSVNRDDLLFSSAEWSPNSRFVYTANSWSLHQVDTWEDDPQNGIRFIDRYNGTLDPFETMIFLMVQGPDCKIYISPKNGAYSLHVINRPDELGKECGFVQNAVKLPNTNSGTMPNFPRFRVDEEDKCDPAITSVLNEAVYYRRALEVFPTPSTGIFTVRLSEPVGKGTLVITNMQGQVIHQKIWEAAVTTERLDISGFPAGHYTIEVFPAENRERVFYGGKVVKVE